MVSSSEEEEEESGSYDEESDPSGEEEDREKPIQKNVVVPRATKPRPERSVPSSSSSKREEEEESSSYDKVSRENSDSFGEEEDDQGKPIQTDVVVPLANKPLQEGSISVPESSTDDEAKKKKMKWSRTDKHVKKLHTEEEVKKRISGDDDDDDDDEAKKQMKRKRTKSIEEEISGDDDEAKKKMKRTRTEATEEATNIYEDVTKQPTPFQRLFSEEDELALLQGILDSTSTRGDLYKDKDGFCDFVKKLICSNASKSQLLSKVYKLKQKFRETVKKSLENEKGGEDKIVFSKGFKHKSFELSRKIWGNASVLVSKPRKKKDESEKTETNVAITPTSFGREIVSVFKAENVTSFGLDESTMLARWNMVADGPKKRAMEENLKTIKEIQVELSLKRIKFVADIANMIFKEVNASSSGYGSQNREVCSIADEEENDVCVKQIECNERNMEEISHLTLANRKHKHTDPKECQICVVSRDTNTGKKNKASVTSATIENEDSFVTTGGIKKREDQIHQSQGKNFLFLILMDCLQISFLLSQIIKRTLVLEEKMFLRDPSFCEDFLKFCFDKFEVGIWSPRKQKNVEKIVEFLLGDMKSKLLFCWGKSNCTTTRVKSLENRNKSVVFKDLNKLWEKYDPKLPWQKGDYNETNTVLLDESPYKAMLNPPYTAIFPHSYDHKNKTDTSLGNGGDLRLYLEKLVEAENVKDFIKKNPFGQEAITEANESWELYSRAIRKHTSI